MFGKVFCLSMVCISMLTSAPVSVEVKSSGVQKLPVLIIKNSDDAATNELIALIQKDLSFTQQCSVSIAEKQIPSNKKELSLLGQQGYPLVLVISKQESESLCYEWRLYGALTARMIAGKKIIGDSCSIAQAAHKLSDSVWPSIAGCPGFFSTKVAYCVEKPLANGTHYKHVYVSGYDGSSSECVIATPTINVAPRWNTASKKPLLFYSECTPSNIRLMMADLGKKKTIVSNFDGLNMLPTFSKDGSKVVYCASKGDGVCHLYYYDKGSFKRLTHNNGNNISPVFSSSDDMIYFCSDFQVGSPHIYSLNLITNAVEKIASGHCSSPAYCPQKQLLAYCKAVQGRHQLFVYDCKTKQHTQVTFDDAKKEECSWSPCGNYIMCCVQKGNSSRVAMVNINSGQYIYITPANLRCSYPSWSSPLC